MKKNKTLFKTACILIILCGVGHTCYELFGPKDPVVFKSINNLAVSLPGGNEARLTSVLLGISVLMGTMLVGIGTINLSLTSLFNAKIPNKILIYLIKHLSDTSKNSANIYCCYFLVSLWQ